jgi:GDPmannose 4,6-dehydratase
VAGFDLTRNYREAYGIRASSGILYNHESPRRGFEFVTRKITSHAARIKLTQVKELRLGNLDSLRDWGHAREYVRAMWMMLQQEEPDDFVIATGEQHSVREFAEAAFNYVGLDYRNHVVIDPQLRRPAEVETLLGDASKAKRQLGWQHEVTFKDLVHEMVESDLRHFSGARGSQVET